MYRGMCTDMWDGYPRLDGGAGSRGEGAEPGGFELGRVRIEDAKEAYGGLLAGFEDVSGASCNLGISLARSWLISACLSDCRCTLRKAARPVGTDAMYR